MNLPSLSTARRALLLLLSAGALGAPLPASSFWPGDKPAATRAPSSGAGFAECPQHFAGGVPPARPAGDKLRELCFNSFAVLHSGSTKTPLYVAERLNRQTYEAGTKPKRGDKFYAEARLPSSERAELADYKGSGWSRGHMAPAGDMGTPEAMAQSFSLANMVPQDRKQNGGPWAKIEEDTRRYVMRAQGDVYVITGPVFEANPPRIGRGVAVPSHLFKLVYDPSTGKSWAHWQENSPSATVGRPISLEEVKRRTGLNLLSSHQN